MLKQEAAQLTGAQPAAMRTIREKEREVLDAWSSLKSRVSLTPNAMEDSSRQELGRGWSSIVLSISSLSSSALAFLSSLLPQSEARKNKLVDSSDFQRFLGQYRDLMAWLSSMQALVSIDELANDVGGAERLLERHQVGVASYCSQ